MHADDHPERREQNTDSTSYELQPERAIPDLPGSVRAGDDLEGTLDLIASDLFVHAQQCVQDFGDFHLAFTHGHEQERLVMKLMTDPKYRAFPWSQTHIWSVMEKCVSPEDPSHSMNHWFELISEAGGVPDEQFHRVLGHLPDSAERYSQEIIDVLEWRERGQDRMDSIILGNDLNVLRVSEQMSDSLMNHSESGDRVVMASRLINATRFIGILAIGSPGRAIVGEIVTNSDQEKHEFGVSPLGGVLRWYLDDYACNRA